MLFGEHAVLNGYPALVGAVDQRLSVTLSAQDDQKIVIDSELGRYETTLDHLTPCSPFSFILAVLEHFKSMLSTGVSLQIKSQFSASVGLGSSSAVTIAAVGALWQLIHQKPPSAEVLFTNASQVIRAVQGEASCADIAASVYGGVVFYQQSPLKIEPLRALPPITLVYSGSKMATPRVIEHVRALQVKDPALTTKCFTTMAELTLQAKAALQVNNWPLLGQLANEHHYCQQQLTVSNATLDHIQTTLVKSPDIFGAKISGSGLGDCVLGFGSLTQTFPGTLDVQLSAKGVSYDPA